MICIFRILPGQVLIHRQTSLTERISFLFSQSWWLKLNCKMLFVVLDYILLKEHRKNPLSAVPYTYTLYYCIFNSKTGNWIANKKKKSALKWMFTHYVGKKEQLDRILLHADNGNFKVYNLLIELFDSLTSLCFFLCRVANSCNRHSLNRNHFPS